MDRNAWSRFSHALARWVLALVVLAAMAPAVSRALGVQAGGNPPGGQAGTDWVEVCGPTGMRWVALGDSASSPPVASHTEAPGSSGSTGAHLAALDPCALCGMGMDRCLPVDPAPLDASASGPHGPLLAHAGPPQVGRRDDRPWATGPPFLS